MKKILILSFMLAVSLFALNAHALTNYDSSFTRITPLALEQGDIFGRPAAFASTVNEFTSATLELSLSNVTSGFLYGVKIPAIGAFFAGTDLSKPLAAGFLQNGLNTFSLTGLGLKNLNAAITTGGIPFGLLLASGNVSLNSARLTGTVAPEPASVALVCAGLVALPFARRFRSKLQKT